MAQMNEKELNRALRTGLPSGVFLLYGSDRYLVERYASLIVDRAVKGDKTFNYERVDGARIDFDHLYDSILTLPMMAERRAVVLDDPDIDKLSAGDLDKLLQILNDAVEPTNFTVPKRCVSVREPYSAERRKAASERAKAAGYQPPVRKSSS